MSAMKKHTLFFPDADTDKDDDDSATIGSLMCPKKREIMYGCKDARTDEGWNKITRAYPKLTLLFL